MVKKRPKRSPIWKLDIEKFKELVKNSNTIGEILRYFGLANHGRNSQTVIQRIEEENINFSHIKRGLNSNKGRKFPSNINTDLWFVANSTIGRKSIKRELIKRQLVKNQCEICGLFPEWNNKKLVLVLDHINGIRNDNRLENLRLLCPNCNSQTDTFAGRNKKYIQIS